MSKPIIKLNTEQKKLVEDNHDLIYGFLTKYKLDFSTWYDVCAIGLCKAGMAYDGSNRFSTFAYLPFLQKHLTYQPLLDTFYILSALRI